MFDVVIYILSGIKVKEAYHVSRLVKVLDLSEGIYMVALNAENGAIVGHKFINQ